MLRRLISLLWFTPLLLIFWNLGYAPFWNPDEGRYATASLEMATPLDGGRQDWLVPHLNTAVRLNKPPLVYWLGASAYRLLGTSEASGRLPSALAAFMVAVVLFFWGQRAWGRKAGQIAALAWGTMALPYAMGRILNTDMLLTFAMTLATFGIWLALRHSDDQGSTAGPFKPSVPWSAALIAGLGMGLALLAKGPVGLALPLAVAFVYLCLSMGWGRAPMRALLAALAIAFLIGGPWYWAVESQRPGFLHTFLFEENLGRFSGTQQYHNKSSHYYYLPVMLLGMLPWTGFMCAVFGQWTRQAADRKVRLFALVWAFFIVVFFSISGTKLPPYVLPAFPPLALLIGAALALGATVVLNLLLVGAGGSFLLNNKTLPRAEALPVISVLAGIMLLATVLLLLAARQVQGKPIVTVQVSTACLLFLVLIPLAGHISAYEDCSGFFKDLKPRLQPGDRVIGFNSFMPTATFYCDRPITYFGFSNTSGLDEGELKESQYFPDFGQEPAQKPALQHRLLQSLMSGRRAWVWSKGRIDDEVEKQLYFWGRNNDFFFYSNQPKPDGYSFDHVAPLKRYKAERPTHPDPGPAQNPKLHPVPRPVPPNPPQP